METVNFFSKDTFVEYWRKYFPALLPWSMVFKIRSGLTVPLSTGDIHMSTVTTMFEFIARLKAIFVLALAFLSAMISSYVWFAVAAAVMLLLDYATFYQFKTEANLRVRVSNPETVPANS
jgi:hypothetical protein